MSPEIDTVPTPSPVPAAPPMVALVGRPNSGKSTLFNRLIRQRRAVVNNTPGVTRDRSIAAATWDRKPFLLVDTGGIDFVENEGLAGQVQAQTRLAIAEADSVICVLDGRQGLNPSDAPVVDLLRRSEVPVYFAINKIDGVKQAALVSDFYALGFDTPYPISAAHGIGVGELMDAVSKDWPHTPGRATSRDQPSEVFDLRLAIIGRPNVGKSSLLNRLVGVPRAIVDSAPGTTRDTLDSIIEWNQKKLLVVDTAGIRRRGRIVESIEQACVLVAFKALERAEIALLVFDAEEGMTDQDARLAQYAWERGRGLVLVANKWDKVSPERKNASQYAKILHELFPVTRPVPVAFVSALTGTRVQRLLPLVDTVGQTHATQIPTGQLNRCIHESAERHTPPLVRGRLPRFYYATQVATRPPLIAIFTNIPGGIATSYTRYLENQLRRTFNLAGTPIKFSYRARHKDRHNPD